MLGVGHGRAVPDTDFFRRTDCMHRVRTLPLLALLTAGLVSCGGDAPAEGGSEAPDQAAAGVAYGEDGFVAVGSPAPDFELRGATRFGVLAEPVSLSDFRGKTVVLAFFFRARGSG